MLAAQGHGRGRVSEPTHQLSHRGALLDGHAGAGVAKMVVVPRQTGRPIGDGSTDAQTDPVRESIVMVERLPLLSVIARPLMTGLVPRKLRKVAGTLVARDSPGLTRYRV